MLFKKRLIGTAQPCNSDLPVGSSGAPTGSVASTSETSADVSQRSSSRTRNLFHLSRMLPDRGNQVSVAESDLGPVLVRARAGAARLGLDAMMPVSRMGQTAVDCVANADTTDAATQSLINTYLRPLMLFNSVVTNIANAHPYARVALGILTAAANLIITQANLDSAVSGLLEKLGFVYELLLEKDTMKNIGDMGDTLANIAQVVSRAAQFVAGYTETKSFWKRLGKNIISQTQSTIDDHTQRLDSLMQQYRDRAVRDIQCNVYRALEDVNLEGMACAAGAGLDKTKRCLDGTRTELIQQIIHWATDGDVNAPRILWLHGQEGSGKSAIAHTVASRIKDVGGFGSCFCFARDKQAEHREQKIFATIARGLADRNPAFRRALADVVSRDYDLKSTCDVVQQWQQLILEPLSKVRGSIVGNVVMVIDGLDESGPEASRRHILSILTSAEAANLPENFRILLTSRLSPDIERALRSRPHVKSTSLDNISAESIERDIRMYVSKQLGHLPGIRDTAVQAIVRKSNGLFEGARVACESVRSNRPCRAIKERFDDGGIRHFGGGAASLDSMCRTFLDDTIRDDAMLARSQYSALRIMSTLNPLFFFLN
ncbi:hypothetical protein EDD17DRAFT_1877351 [Pisolithus thermaeus]|nr:hypothetical protein EDD17DRAFT_1877351 [Pisolithus thermaeus]